jgi:hypothetical protein
MAPAADLLGLLVVGMCASFAAEDGVIDGVRVGLDVAAEASEHVAHRGARVLRLKFEEDVVPVGEHDEEVTLAACLAPARGLGLDAPFASFAIASTMHPSVAPRSSA